MASIGATFVDICGCAVQIIAEDVRSIMSEEHPVRAVSRGTPSFDAAATAQILGFRASFVHTLDVCSKMHPRISSRTFHIVARIHRIATLISVHLTAPEVRTFVVVIVPSRHKILGTFERATPAIFCTTFVVIGEFCAILVVTQNVLSIISQHEASWTLKQSAPSLLC
jgi:hypothetical protein